MKEAQRNAEINELKNDVQILLKRAILEKAEADELKSILQVLLSILDTDQTARLSCFNWLDTILEKSIAEDEIILYLPGKILYKIRSNYMLPTLIDILKSTAKTIDINERDSGIKILMKIANLSNKCFQSFMESLLELIELMSESPDDKNRIAFIIRQICEIRGEEVYSSIAELLLSKQSKSTIRLMNILLATAPQLHSVRVTLRRVYKMML